MDYRAFRALNGLAGYGLDSVFAVFATDLAGVLMVLVALTFLVPWPRRRAGAVLGTASASLALLVSQPISHAVERIRPYLAHPGHAHLLIARSQDFSFPSDHAVGGFALAFGIWLYDCTLGGALLVLATILALSRVVVGTHYPGDALAGATLGAASSGLLFAVPVTRRMLQRVADRAVALCDRVPARA